MLKYIISNYIEVYRYLICAKVIDQLEEFEIQPSKYDIHFLSPFLMININKNDYLFYIYSILKKKKKKLK